MMHTLRLGALGATLSLFIVLVPVLLLGLAFPGDAVWSLRDSLLVVAGVPLALTAGYILVFMRGARMIWSLKLRLAGAVLLAIPACAGALPLLSGHTEFAPVAVPLLLFTVVLFSAFVFPAWLRRAPSAS